MLVLQPASPIGFLQIGSSSHPLRVDATGFVLANMFALHHAFHARIEKVGLPLLARKKDAAEIAPGADLHTSREIK